jgi:Tfp pilus assembly protein PilO
MLHSLLEKRIAITIGLFVLLAGIIVGAVIVPTVLQIRQIDKDTYNLRLSLERKNEQATNYRLALKQIEKLKKEMPPFDNYLFNKGEELKLITSLESLAVKHNVSQRINSSNLDNITNQKVQVSLSLSGTYINSLSYLDEIEHLPYFINLTRFSLSPYVDRTNPNQTDNVVMSLDFNLYVIP